MKKASAVLFLIIILTFVLRFYKVTNVPPSLNWDEVSIGYNAYSILKTGHDEWGEFLPLHFKSFGEYKLPMQIYSSIPGIWIFGLNPLGVRITPVVYGVLTVLFLYLLTKELFKKDSIAAVSAFFLAVSPWHIQLTRGSFESSFALMWVVLGVWFYVKGLTKSVWWVLSIFPLSLAVYTYNSARMFVPLFLVTLFFLYRKEHFRFIKKSVASVLLFTILMLPVALFFIGGEGGARYKLVSITDEAGLVPRIDERRNTSSLPEPIIKLLYNRPVYLSYYFARNYFTHYTPDFLFINGAGHRQHHVQGIGQLYYVQAIFLLVGFYFLFKRKEKFAPLLLFWILLSNVPAAITMDSIPHALRTLNAVGAYSVVTGYGAYHAYSWLDKKKNIRLVVLGIFISVFVFQFTGYQKNLYIRYPILYSRDWQYGYREAVGYIKDNYDNYDMIVFTREYGEPHIFTLFYMNYDPLKFQNDPALVRFETNDWVRVLKFDKFYFPDLFY